MVPGNFDATGLHEPNNGHTVHQYGASVVIRSKLFGCEIAVERVQVVIQHGVALLVRYRVRNQIEVFIQRTGVNVKTEQVMMGERVLVCHL